MDADPKQHPAVLGERRRRGAEGALHRQRAIDRAGGGVEDGEHRVAGHVDDASLVRGDRVAEHRARAVERRDRAALVAAHQARVASDVGDEDRRQALTKGGVGRSHGQGSMVLRRVDGASP